MIEFAEKKYYKVHQHGMGIDLGIKRISADNPNIVKDINGRPMLKTVCGHGCCMYDYLLPDDTPDDKLDELDKQYSRECKVSEDKAEKQREVELRYSEYLKAKKIVEDYEK